VLEQALEAYRKVKEPSENNKPQYTTLLHKFDRTTYKHKRDDIVVVSNESIRVFGFPKMKEKFALKFSDLQSISISKFSDGLIVISTPGLEKGDKGDFIFDTPHVIEFATYIIHTHRVKPAAPSPGGETFHGVRMPEVAENLSILAEMEPTLKGGKVGKIVFDEGEAEYQVVKLDKVKALKIIAPKVDDAEGFTKRVRQSLRLRASNPEE